MVAGEGCAVDRAGYRVRHNIEPHNPANDGNNNSNNNNYNDNGIYAPIWTTIITIVVYGNAGNPNRLPDTQDAGRRAKMIKIIILLHDVWARHGYNNVPL